jgi:hypothetical protein
MKKLEVTLENTNGILVNLTAEEIVFKNTDEAQFAIEKKEIKDAEQAAINKKASGKQKLLDLGLTESEIKSLIGV